MLADVYEVKITRQAQEQIAEMKVYVTAVIYSNCWVGITYRDKSSVPGLNYLVNGFNTLSKII